MALSRYQDIRQPVKSGFIDFVRIAENLSEVSEINSRNANRISARIKPDIQSMCRNFKRANDSCESEVDKCHRNIEEIVRDISRKKSKIRSLEYDKSKLSQEITGLKNKEKIEWDYLSDRQRNVNEKEEIKQDADRRYERARNEQEGMAVATVVSAFIPFVNIIATPTLAILSLTVFEKAKREARDALNHARSLCEEARSALDRTRSSIRSIVKQISNKQDELERARREHGSMNSQLDQLRRSQEQKVFEQRLLHDSFTYLSLAFSKADHLKKSTAKLYSSHQIKQPFLDLGKHFLDSQGREFTYITGNLDMRMIANKIEEINCFVSKENMITMEDFC